MNLPNGKDTSTGAPNIGLASAGELCQLIKVCAKSGVKSFQFGGVHLEFGQIDQSTPTIPIPRQTSQDETQAVKISAEATEKIAVDRLRDDLEELKLSDPLAYEKFIEGTLGDAIGGTE